MQQTASYWLRGSKDVTVTLMLVDLDLTPFSNDEVWICYYYYFRKVAT